MYVLAAPWVHVFECTVCVGPIGPSLCGPTHGVGPAFSCGAHPQVVRQCVCTSHMHYARAVHRECMCKHRCVYNSSWIPCNAGTHNRVKVLLEGGGVNIVI